ETTGRARRCGVAGGGVGGGVTVTGGTCTVPGARAGVGSVDGAAGASGGAVGAGSAGDGLLGASGGEGIGGGACGADGAVSDEDGVCDEAMSVEVSSTSAVLLNRKKRLAHTDIKTPRPRRKRSGPRTLMR